jgi:hypothetical protein
VSLDALDEKTGKIRWSFPIEPPAALGNDQMGDPIYYDGKVAVLGSNGILYCLNAATGKPVWQKTVDTPNGELFHLDSLAKNGDLLCFRAGNNPCLDAKTGDLKWEAKGHNFWHPSVLARGAIWMPDLHSLLALDRETGSLKREQSLPSVTWMDWLETDGVYLYVVHPDGVMQLEPPVRGD